MTLSLSDVNDWREFDRWMERGDLMDLSKVSRFASYPTQLALHHPHPHRAHMYRMEMLQWASSLHLSNVHRLYSWDWANLALVLHTLGRYRLWRQLIYMYRISQRCSNS